MQPRVSAVSLLDAAAWLRAAARLDGQDVDDERRPPQPLHREGGQHTLHGQDGRGDDDHVRLLRTRARRGHHAASAQAQQDGAQR